MDSPSLTDAELLAEWLADQREPAFHALVARHAGLVHAAARRVCGGDETLAAEASQLTFILLARKAGSLAGRRSLAGWLHLTAVMQARNLLRQSRRESRKRQALLTDLKTTDPLTRAAADPWSDLRPVLDSALAALSDKDREALLLRFYRSLSVGEVAHTLGIATDAAQKRLTRAAARLRGQLSRRGCHTAAASIPAGILAAGFAADAGAAAPPVSLLASQALTAAAGAPSWPGILTFLSAAAMKTTSPVPPAIALLLLAAWLASTHSAARAVEAENAVLQASIARHLAAASARNASPLGSGSASSRSLNSSIPRGLLDHSQPVDWREIGARLAELQALGISDSTDSMMLEMRLSSMSKEDLAAALREIADSGMPDTARRALEDQIMHPLSRSSPEFTVRELASYVNSAGVSAMYVSDAFDTWVKKDPAAAGAWMDGRIAEGFFRSKSLDGKNWARNRFEGALITALLASDPAAAARRLESLPADQRGSLALGQVDPEHRPAFARMIREHLSAEGRNEVLGKQARRIVNEGYPAVSSWLDSIQATPEERAACVEQAAIGKSHKLVIGGKPDPQALEDLRAWAAAAAPGSVESATGAALGYAAWGRELEFSAAAETVIRYQEAGGGDDVLVSFLKSEGPRAAANRDAALALTPRITDEKRRDQVIKYLNKRN